MKSKQTILRDIRNFKRFIVEIATMDDNLRSACLGHLAGLEKDILEDEPGAGVKMKRIQRILKNAKMIYPSTMVLSEDFYNSPIFDPHKGPPFSPPRH